MHRVFCSLFALLVVSFYVMPDQAGRNLLLYLTALSAHGFVLGREAWRPAYGHPGGWVVLLLVSMPAASLVWSTGAGWDTHKDLLIAAYCVLAIYLGVARVLDSRPQLADALAVLVIGIGNVAGALAIGQWLLTDSSPGTVRLEGLLGIDNPVHASVLLLGGTLPLFAQVLWSKRSPVWLAAMVVPICFVVLAGGRMAAGAYLLVVLLMAALWRPRAATWVIAGGVVIAGSAIMLLGTPIITEVWLGRGLSFRDVVWEQVWNAYRACNPVVGCGLATPLTVNVGSVEGERAHSVFFAALYHQGLFGVAVFIACLAWLLRAGLKDASPTGDRARGWAWMLGYVVLANVTSGDHVLVRATLFWPCFWMPVMVVAAMSRGSLPAGRT